MWLELILFMVLLIIIDTFIRERAQRRMGHIPIVSKIPFIGGALKLQQFQPDNMHLKFEEYFQRYGKTFYARVFGSVFMITGDVRYTNDILSSYNHNHLRKHLLYLMLNSWLGSGLLLSYSHQWQTMRKIITPTFHFKILEQFVDVFDRQSTILIEKLQTMADGKTVIDIYPHMGLLTLDIIAETAMGISINAQVNSKSEFVQAVKDVTNIVATRFIRPQLSFPFVFRFVAPNYYKALNDGIKYMHKFTDQIIEERRKTLQTTIKDDKQSQEETDMGIKKRMALLDVLLQSTIDGKPLPDKQIRDEVNTFMFEGHDTTTTAVSFTLYLISRHPKCQQKLFAEIREHFGDDLQRSITYSDLLDLNYLNCVVKESLRLYPPVPAIGRYLGEDLKTADITIPKGVNILILLWMLLRDPAVYTEPEKFLPERHLVEQPQQSSFNNIPFSAGPRNCIGQRFALFEMKTIIIKVLRNYELIELGAAVHPSMKIVLRSKTGVNFGLKARVY